MEIKFKRPALVVSEADQKRQELERTLALADAAGSPLFKAILSYADDYARLEHEAALRPDLANEVRQFNCGRSASAYDFALALREIQARAASTAHKEKSKE